MYFAKARKQMEEQDMKEMQEKLEKYQRSDTTRVLQQAKSLRVEDNTDRIRDEFRVEELPDGAFVSPKHTPSHSSTSLKSDPLTAFRSAEYTGSFSVCGIDEEARTKTVESQLEALRSVTKSKKVVIVISLDGVKVCSTDRQTVYMFHELKRISYATCDPDHCQFSFLAREPQGQMNVQYCHAFLTQTPEEAEELNAIIGNAFKMAYAQQREKQPTFHELIEAQVAEQRAKFLEIEKQAQVELQKKLADIARPTPFSQQAIQRMEQRRQASEEIAQEEEYVIGKNRLWAKQIIEKVQHRSSLHEASLIASSSQQSSSSRFSEPPLSSISNRPQDSNVDLIIGSKSYVHKNVGKHNSAPLFPAHLGSPSDEPPSQGENVSCVIPHHPLSVHAIRVSLENKNNAKFKGSPVTALKNEIDRRFLTNGSETAPLESVTSGSLVSGERETEHRAVKHEQVRHQIHMANRPLPTVPDHFSPLQGRSSSNKGFPRQRPTSSYHWRSYDDHNLLPTSSSSPSPLCHSSKQTNGVAIRDSPRRKQPRPLSEIATSSGAPVTGSNVGSRLFDHRFPVSIHEVSSAGSSPSSSPRHQPYHPPQHSASKDSTDSGGVYNYGPASGAVMAELRAGGKTPRFETNQKSLAQDRTGVSGGSSAASGNTEVVLRYQNDSPFHKEDQETASKLHQGLESLMCLDRSHIEDPSLRQAPWYQAGIPREIALEILSQEEPGSFIVRDSTTHPGCFALSVRVPKFENSSGISHYLILKTQRGVKLKGLDKEWPNLTALVTHHTVMPEMLPCTLRLPRNNKNLTFRASEREERDEEDESSYQRLADVTALAGQLKL